MGNSKRKHSRQTEQNELCVRSCEWLNKVRKEVTNREQTKRWTGELGEGQTMKGLICQAMYSLIFIFFFFYGHTCGTWTFLDWGQIRVARLQQDGIFNLLSRPEAEPAFSWTLYQVLNPLSHNRNSLMFLLRLMGNHWKVLLREGT